MSPCPSTPPPSCSSPHRFLKCISQRQRTRKYSGQDLDVGTPTFSSKLACCMEVMLWPQGQACPLPIRHRGHWLDCEHFGHSTLGRCTHFWWNPPTVQHSVICIVLFNNCLVVSCHTSVRAWTLLSTQIQAPSLTYMPTPSGCLLSKRLAAWDTLSFFNSMAPFFQLVSSQVIKLCLRGRVLGKWTGIIRWINQ